MAGSRGPWRLANLRVGHFAVGIRIQDDLGRRLKEQFSSKNGVNLGEMFTLFAGISP
jgi:hypothetical protein